MQFRYFGMPADPSSLVPGQFFVASDGSESILALVVEDDTGKFCAVLRAWGKPRSDTPVPYPLDLSAIPGASSSSGVSRLGQNIIAEPLAADIAHQYEVAPDPNGAKGSLVLTSGNAGVVVGSQRGNRLFSLGTGKVIKLEHSTLRTYHKRWRLTWREDKEVVSLCEFGASG